MKKKKPYRIIRQNDIILIVGITTAVLFMSAYPDPFVASALVALGIIIMRFIDAPKGDETEDGLIIEPEPKSPYEGMQPEEILMIKLSDGTLEKAVAERADKMIDGVVDDLFDNYGDVSTQLKAQLTQSMLKHIEDYNYGAHDVVIKALIERAVMNAVSNDADQKPK